MFAVTFGLIAWIVLAIIVRGWVLTVLWGWFLVPLGAPALSIPFALGISTIIGLFLQNVSRTKSEGSTVPNLVAQSLLGPLVSLLVGWIITWWI